VGDLAGTEPGERPPWAASVRNPRQRNHGSQRHDDVSFLTPAGAPWGAAAAATAGAEVHGHPALDGDFLKLIAREKTNLLPIGREERIGAIFRA
jgi:hypothetical protein